jgi:hypothetical protein
MPDFRDIENLFLDEVLPEPGLGLDYYIDIDDEFFTLLDKIDMAGGSVAQAAGSGSLSANGVLQGSGGGQGSASGALSLGPAPASWTARPGVQMTPGIGGFYEFKPAGWNLSSKPAMIVFHGIGDRGDGNSQLNNILATPPAQYFNNRFGTGASFQYDMIVILVQYTTPGNNIPTPTMVQGAIDYVKANYNVNTRKIYLNGTSLGGGGILGWADEGNLQDIAAITLVCPALNYNAGIAAKLKAVNMPMWFFHGDQDNVVPYSISVNWTNGLNTPPNAINPAVQLRTYPGEFHNVWPDAVEFGYTQANGFDVYSFSLQFERLPQEFMTGASGGQASGTGQMSATGSMQGQGQGQASATGNMTPSMQGQANGQANASGQLSGNGSLQGGGQGQAGGSGQISGNGQIQGQANGQAGGSGQLSANGQMQGQGNGDSDGVGSMHAGAIAGQSNGQANASGQLQGAAAIQGSGQGHGHGTGQISGDTSLAGSASGQATVEGVAYADGMMNGQSGGSSSAIGTISEAGVMEITDLVDDSPVETQVTMKTAIEQIVLL